MQQLGGADAVDDAQARALVPGLPGGRGQVLPGRDTAPQGRDVVAVEVVEHRAVGGGGGEQHGDPVPGDGRQQLSRSRLLQQQRARPGAQREDDQPAEAEGEAERGAAREDVVGAGPQDVPGEGVGDGEDVPVEVHAALGPAGGAGGEGDQGHVVGRGRDGLERGPGCRAVEEVVRRVPAVGRDPQVRDLGLGEVVDGADVAQRVPHPGDLAHGAQLVRTLLGEHGDRDGARLQHGQPAGREPRCGGAAQQHPVAGDDAEFAGEQVRDAVHPGAQVAVRPRLAGGGEERRAVVGRAAEQFGGAVEPFGVAQLRQVETELGPLGRRWQLVAGEGVDVGRAPWIHTVRPLGVVGSPLERIVLMTTVNGPR